MKKNTIIATIAALVIAPSIAFAKDHAKNQSNLQLRRYDINYRLW